MLSQISYTILDNYLAADRRASNLSTPCYEFATPNLPFLALLCMTRSTSLKMRYQIKDIFRNFKKNMNKFINYLCFTYLFAEFAYTCEHVLQKVINPNIEDLPRKKLSAYECKTGSFLYFPFIRIVGLCTVDLL